MSEIARIKSGIPGLDEVLEGGLPRNYAYAVVGAPGSGKTVMGAQFLYRGATQYGDNGVFVSLEEPTHSIANTMLRFNWNLFDLESQGKLVLLDASPHQDQPNAELKIRGGSVGTEKFDLDGLLGAVAHARKNVAAKRCVIDSLMSISAAYTQQSGFRFRFLHFLRALSELELTTLILTESQTPVIREYGLDSVLTNGTVLLHTITENEVVNQVMEIPKMRGVKVQRRLMPYQITQNGIEVKPQEQ
ncbi:MAG TPA: ATPase domain-containing protein [Candidatus Dormibacteraeota bacterium]|nr:ATPase domain-containing protein [Candidatus Dormibacteraeota bacterium]